jgi:DNA-binding transcriptional ArsR family regulator
MVTFGSVGVGEVSQTLIVSSFVTLHKMSYDTKHVRNAGDNPETITGIPTFTDLLTNTALASLYTTIRHSSTATAPELVETADVSKKTVYEYLHKLEQAGLITETGEEDGTSVYEAEDFELTLTVREIKVSITPELIVIIAHQDEHPVISRVLNDHGIVTFALAHDLVNAHADGDITIRQLASLTGLSTGTAYDLVEALYETSDLDNDSSPTTYTPDNAGDEDNTLPDELRNE